MCNDFVVALYLRMEETAVKQLERNQHNIITSCEVQTAVGLLLSGELATRAVAKGMEAERKFKSTQGLQKSERAGVTFPVGRLHALLKFRLKQKIKVSAPVYLAAVLDYVVREILEVEAISAFEPEDLLLTPSNIFSSISQDSEMNQLLANVGLAIIKVPSRSYPKYFQHVRLVEIQ